MSGDNRLFTLMEAGRLHEGGSEVVYETEAASGRHPHWIKVYLWKLLIIIIKLRNI